MSDYFRSLAERVLGRTTLVEPRLRALFEPTGPWLPPSLEDETVIEATPAVAAVSPSPAPTRAAADRPADGTLRASIPQPHDHGVRTPSPSSLLRSPVFDVETPLASLHMGGSVLPGVRMQASGDAWRDEPGVMGPRETEPPFARPSAGGEAATEVPTARLLATRPYPEPTRAVPVAERAVGATSAPDGSTRDAPRGEMRPTHAHEASGDEWNAHPPTGERPGEGPVRRVQLPRVTARVPVPAAPLPDVGAPQPADPTVHVTIGRVELRVVAPVPSSPAGRAQPYMMSLEEYARRRKAGEA